MLTSPAFVYRVSGCILIVSRFPKPRVNEIASRLPTAASKAQETETHSDSSSKTEGAAHYMYTQIRPYLYPRFEAWDAAMNKIIDQKLEAQRVP